MKTYIIITALLAILGSCDAKDWGAIQSDVAHLSEKIKSFILALGNEITKDNAAIGDKLKPVLKDHETQALEVLEQGAKCAKDETLTEEKVKEGAEKVKEIVADLKAAVSGDMKQLSEEGRQKVSQMCQTAREEFQVLVDGLIAKLKA